MVVVVCEGQHRQRTGPTGSMVMGSHVQSLQFPTRNSGGASRLSHQSGTHKAAVPCVGAFDWFVMHVLQN